ncbi:MAG: AraC family transcriptional regulator [Caulobacteraceae bacterium]
MDALSDILRVVRLSGAFFFHARFTAPFCYAAARASDLAPLVEPGAERLVIFHLITQGECWIEPEGLAPVRLQAGDVALLPHNHAHRMASAAGLPAQPGGELAALISPQPRLISYGGGGVPTLMVCGFMACEAGLGRMLLAGLPPVVRAPLLGTEAWSWLESSVGYALAEARSGRPGGAGVLSKLAEVLFIEVLRNRMAAEDEDAVGWLAGVRDRVVGAALAALHRKPAHPWTLEELARTVGASRSVLAERFQKLMGVSPMQYLTQWRMVMAASLLRRSGAQLTHIAQDVGYQADTAFIRAFRRQYGQSPAAWRRAQTQDLAVVSAS